MEGQIITKNKNVVLSNTQSIAVTAVLIAFTYVFTKFVNIKLPLAGNGGLIHLGNIPLFIAAIVFGWKVGMIAGGVGMALFDITSGWASWAPFTLIVVGLMGFAVGKISENSKSQKQLIKNAYVRNLIAVIVAALIKIAGYYIAEVVLYGNFVVPLSSIPGNLIQVGTAAVIVLPISVRLKRAADRIFDN